MWSAFALWTATAWDRLPRSWRIVGVSLIAACGVAILTAAIVFGHSSALQRRRGTVETFSAWETLQTIPPSIWNAMLPTATIIGLLLALFSGLAIYFIATGRRRLAATMIAAAMVPTGLGMIDGVSRMAQFFSLANAARYLNAHLGETGEVVYEGALHRGSSLVFYLHRKFSIVNPPDVDDSFPGIEPKAVVISEDALFEKWAAPENMFLIVDQSRVPYWEAELTRRFHIFDQVNASGGHVVLSNQL